MESPQSSNTTKMLLPDDILCAIIRCLPMMEAVKTSTLSKRWRYLWRSSLSDIDFDETKLSRISAPGHFGAESVFNFQIERSRWLARILNGFIDLHTASKMHTFRIYFPMREENVDHLVTFAMKKQTEKLILDFSGSSCFGYTERCSFSLVLLEDGRVSSWLKHLCVSSCNLGSVGTVNQVCGLASLKTLSLEMVTFVGEQSLQSLIFSCPLLESLTLKRCTLRSFNLVIDTSFSRLKHLSLSLRASVVISCPNLISLECQIEDICLCDDHVLGSLQVPIPREEEISCRCYITTLLSQDPSRFASLKAVTLECKEFTEDDFINLFSACPNLDSLLLYQCIARASVIPFHHNLKFLDLNDINFDPEGPFKIYCGPNLISLYLRYTIFEEETSVKLVNGDGHVFSSSFPSPLQHLQITECTPHHSNYAAFKYLRELTLGPVGLDDEDILNLLSHCYCLERLSLSGGGSKLRHFKIPFHSHPLKYLEFKDNNFLQMIELCSTNLATLELHTTFKVPLHVKHAPRLTRVSIGSWCKDTRDETLRSMKELSILVPGLETLTLFLTTSSSKLEEDMLIGLPEFKHLKRLVVILEGSPQSVLWMISLIQIAPRLRIFELHLGNSMFEQEAMYVPNEIEQIKYSHNHLKEVKISGFIGMKYEMEMAIYLLKYSASLELLTIEPELLVYEGDDTWKKKEMAIFGFQFVRSWLMEHVSPPTRLVIL